MITSQWLVSLRVPLRNERVQYDTFWNNTGTSIQPHFSLVLVVVIWGSSSGHVAVFLPGGLLLSGSCRGRYCRNCCEWRERESLLALCTLRITTPKSVGISIFVTFSALLRLSQDWPVVTGGGNWGTRWKPPPNSKSLANFSHVQGGIQTQAVVRDS